MHLYRIRASPKFVVNVHVQNQRKITSFDPDKTMKGNRRKSRLKQLCYARTSKEGKDSVPAENAGNDGSDGVIASVSDSDQNRGGGADECFKA